MTAENSPGRIEQLLERFVIYSDTGVRAPDKSNAPDSPIALQSLGFNKKLLVGPEKPILMSEKAADRFYGLMVAKMVEGSREGTLQPSPYPVNATEVFIEPKETATNNDHPPQQVVIGALIHGALHTLNPVPNLKTIQTAVIKHVPHLNGHSNGIHEQPVANTIGIPETSPVDTNGNLAPFERRASKPLQLALNLIIPEESIQFSIASFPRYKIYAYQDSATNNGMDYKIEGNVMTVMGKGNEYADFFRGITLNTQERLSRMNAHILSRPPMIFHDEEHIQPIIKVITPNVKSPQYSEQYYAHVNSRPSQIFKDEEHEVPTISAGVPDVESSPAKKLPQRGPIFDRLRPAASSVAHMISPTH